MPWTVFAFGKAWLKTLKIIGRWMAWLYNCGVISCWQAHKDTSIVCFRHVERSKVPEAIDQRWSEVVPQSQSSSPGGPCYWLQRGPWSAEWQLPASTRLEPVRVVPESLSMFFPMFRCPHGKPTHFCEGWFWGKRRRREARILTAKCCQYLLVYWTSTCQGKSCILHSAWTSDCKLKDLSNLSILPQPKGWPAHLRCREMVYFQRHSQRFGGDKNNTSDVYFSEPKTQEERLSIASDVSPSAPEKNLWKCQTARILLIYLSGGVQLHWQGLWRIGYW